MKKIALCALATALTALSITQVHAQQNKWYLPPYHYDMSTPTPTPNPSTSNYNYASQSIYDKAGNLLFYIHNQQVYKGDGTYTTDLPAFKTGSGTYNTSGSKMIIVPVPLVCDKYYVIYALVAPALLGDANIFSVIIDMSSGSPVIDPSSLHPASIDGGFGDNPARIARYSAFAVSRPISNLNDRYLFAMQANTLKKFSITSAGISEQSTVYTLTGSNFNPTAIELSSDQKYLAFCPGYSDNKLYQVQLDGSFNAVATSSADLGYRPIGLQYDATSSYLFASGTPGVKWHTAANFTTGAFTAVTGATGLSYATLEMGKTGNIYGVTNSNMLAYISTAAMPSPTVTTTNITINQSFTDFPAGKTFALPVQIDGQDYNDFGARPKPRVDFSLGGLTANSIATPATAVSVYTCSDILFGNTGTPDRYLLNVQSCDASGNVISGAGYLNYSSGYRQYVAGFIDFKALPVGTSGTNTWLADPAHPGYYKVTLYTTNLCNEISVPKVGYFKLNAPPSAATINFQINNPSSGTPCNNKVIGTACPIGTWSGTYNIGAPGTSYATNNITSYSRKIEEVDCTTGNVVSLLYQDATPVVPANPNGGSTGLSLNLLVINGSTGYFANNSLGKCYKFTLTASNVCSSASDWFYFKVDGMYKPGTTAIQNTNGTPYALDVFPNPAQNHLTVKFTLQEGMQTRLDIYDIQGKLLIRGKELYGNAGVNNREVDMTQLAAGTYIYKISIGSESVSGRISKL